MMSDTAMAMKKGEEGDARVPSAATITTNWQDAMTGGGGQRISHGHDDLGIPKKKHSNSSSTNADSSNGMRRSVSFDCDNIDILAEAKVEDLKPPASATDNAANEEIDDEGYEKFLALLASPPAPAQAPPSISLSTSSMTLSITEHDPSAVSSNRYLPPSAQAPATDDGQECKIEAVGIDSLTDPIDYLYDPPQLGEKREEEEVGVPMIITSIKDPADGDDTATTSRIQGAESNLSIKSLISRSVSFSDISKMSTTLSIQGTETVAAVAPEKDPETERLSKESSSAGDLKRRPSFNQMKSFQPEFRRPSRRSDRLSVSWHPNPQYKDSSDQPETERKEINKRPNLMRQAKTILRKERRLSMQGLNQRSVSVIDPVQMEQIQIIDDDKVHPSRKQLHWWHGVFFFSIICLLICLLQLTLPPPYGLMMTSTEVAAVGVAPGCDDELQHCICPRETICATDKLSIILLALARCSAFFDYPLYMMLFLSKAHNLNNHFRRTLFREWVDFGDMHTVHKIFGIVVGIETMFHSFFHLLRWGLNNEINLLWQTATGITGFITAAVTPLICWPMVVPFLKRRFSFEVRKGLHYLSIVWAIALLFHAPSKIPWLIGLPALVYVLDFLFGYFRKNNLIETAYFERYGENGVAVHFENPKSWDSRPPTSYVYIMCPWISKYQWHAFTMFPEPLKENHSMLCIGASGDWTKQLYNKIQAPCLRQLYVHGPLMTEFSDRAITTSNAIAVATGVGITPTLSMMMNYVGRKRINIIWVCRDPGLIEYTLHKMDIGAITKKSYAFIFYTGQRDLALPKHLPVNIFIIRSRPNLENTITGIITAIHSGEGLPEEMYERQKKIANTPFRKRMMIAMNRVTQIYGENEMFDYAVTETEKAAERMQDIDLEAGGAEAGGASDSDDELHPQCSTRLLVEPPPPNTVSLLGFDAMISRFLGVIGEYSDSDIEELFYTIDTDRSGFIDRGEFNDLLQMLNSIYAANRNRRSSKQLLSSMVALTDMEAALTSSMHNSTRASSHHVNTTHGSLFGDNDTIEYMKALMNESFRTGEKPLEEWSLFYCGGSTGIKKTLQDISKRYDIDLAVEKFDW